MGDGCVRGRRRTGNGAANGCSRASAAGNRAEARHARCGAHEAGNPGPCAGPAANHGIHIAATGPEQDKRGQRIDWSGRGRGRRGRRGRHRCGGIKPAVQHGIHHRRRPQEPLHQPPSQARCCNRTRARPCVPTLLPLLRRQPPHGHLPVKQGPDWKEGSHRTQSHQHGTRDSRRGISKDQSSQNTRTRTKTLSQTVSLRQLVDTRLKHCAGDPPGLATANLRCRPCYSPAANCPKQLTSRLKRTPNGRTERQGRVLNVRTVSNTCVR